VLPPPPIASPAVQ
jgi:hypothetical protein